MGAYKALEEKGVNIISNTTQVGDALIALGIPSDSITIIPGDATSTQMEAMLIRDYIAEKKGVNSLILVSSAHHTRRASMIFNAVLKSLEEPVTVHCSPSKYTKFDAERWWRSKDGIEDVVLSYMKMGSFLVGSRQ